MSHRLPAELEKALGRVAAQYRKRLWTRALFGFGVTALALVAIAVPAFYAAEGLGIGRGAEWGALLGAIAVAAAVWSIYPLRRRTTPRDIALYIDERHPEFQNRLISAVEISAHKGDRESAWMVEQILRESAALAADAATPDILAPGKGAVWAARGVMALALIGGAYLFASFAPVRWGSLEGEPGVFANVAFTVEPGNAKVRTGSNQTILVKLAGAEDNVAIQWRRSGGPWEAAAMSVGADAAVRHYPFTSLQQTVEYQVRVGKAESEVFTLAVWSPPNVDRMNHTYTFPEYLEQAPEVVPNAGNIQVIEGTEVAVEVDVNKAVASAEMVFESGERVALERVNDVVWRTAFTVAEDDAYTIELKDAEGNGNERPRRHTIKATPDKAPEIALNFPRGDGEATRIEEVPFLFNVTDDHGLVEYGVQYEIAGQEPVRVPMPMEAGEAVRSAAGDHLLMLEEMALAAGDFITWTVYALDKKPDRDEYDTQGSPYFLEIMPFRRTYREAVSNQGAMGGAGAGAGQEAMDQKEIMIATWNLRKNAKRLEDDDFHADLDKIIESQQGMLAELTNPMTAGAGDPAEIAAVEEAMKKALEALAGAEKPKPEGKLSEAMTHMQTAYRAMLRMRPDETEVAQQQAGQQGGGGGGGGSTPDVDALEIEQRTDFAEETASLEQEEQAAAEALDALKDLAKRQEIINEDLAKLLSELQTATPEEEEEIRRKLEQLKEEQRRNMEAADALQGEMAAGEMNAEQAENAREPLEQAREQMNRSLENMDETDLQRAQTAGSRASRALDEIEEQLSQLTGDAAAQRLEQVKQELAELREEQRRIEEKTAELKESQERPGLDGLGEREAQTEEIVSEKQELANRFEEFMEDAANLAERSAQSQELMSQKLGDWLRETAGDGILEDLSNPQPMLEYGFWEEAMRQEEALGGKFDEARQRLEEVGEYLVADELDGMQKALEELQEIMQGGSTETAQNEGEPGPSAEPGQEQGAQGGEPDPNGEGQGMTADPSGEATQMAQGGEGEPGEEEAQGAGPGESGEPGEENEERQQMARGDTPGEQPFPGAEGEQEGREPGAEGGQPGQEPSEQQSEQPGQQPGGQQGQGQQGDQPGQQSPEGQPSQQGQQPGSMQPGQQQGGPDGGGGFGPWMPGGGRDLEQFFNEDYREWNERLRNAERLLPEDSPLRRDLTRIQENLDAMRREYQRDWLAPKFDLFLENAATPLVETAEALSEEIRRLLSEEEYLVADEGDVPAEYGEQVSRYFRALSEAGTD